MYSVVLMMALTSGGDVPALGHGCRGGCHGCYGGCYGSCYGCSGGGHKHQRRGHGCRGGCHGCNGGCYGSCYGCSGGGHKHQRRSHGCCGCCGGGYSYGCYGGGYGHGCVGGMGGMGGMGGAIVPNTVVPGNAAPAAAPKAPAAPAKKKISMENAAPATLIVTVPADARLSIDGEVTTLTSTERVFVSPALNFGREYHYTLQAEFQKDGKTVTTTKDVAIKAGEETRVRFDVDSLVSR